jgi:hypothetical protein
VGGSAPNEVGSTVSGRELEAAYSETASKENFWISISRKEMEGEVGKLKIEAPPCEDSES